jgi:hypothetical protein
MIILVIALYLIIIAFSVAGARRRYQQVLYAFAPERIADAQTKRRKSEGNAIAPQGLSENG